MRRSALALIAATGVAVTSFSALGDDCSPDGGEGLLPTFDAEYQCGDLGICLKLAHDNRLKEASACEQKFDKCLAELNKSNAEADAHNEAVEACRAAMPSQPKTPNVKPSGAGASSTAPNK